MPMTADSVHFPPQVERGAVRRIMTETIVQSSEAGLEERIPRFSYPRRQWQLAFGPEYVSAIEAVIYTQNGPERSFLFYPPDPSDRIAAQQQIGIGDAYENSFQLVVNYKTYDRFNNLVRQVDKPIYHPREETVQVFIDDVETTAFSLTTAGLVILDVPPNGGEVVTASFEYDTPVRLYSDDNETTHIDSTKSSDLEEAQIVSAVRAITIIEVFGE